VPRVIKQKLRNEWQYGVHPGPKRVKLKHSEPLGAGISREANWRIKMCSLKESFPIIFKSCWNQQQPLMKLELPWIGGYRVNNLKPTEDKKKFQGKKTPALLNEAEFPFYFLVVQWTVSKLRFLILLCIIVTSVCQLCVIANLFFCSVHFSILISTLISLHM
jgi:hypothetical protein